ncbi:MAG: class I SAM-dependent methyltransferase [Bacillota bacterium]
MKSISGVGLSDVQAVYSGCEGDLWELVMGEQIHIGGLQSSHDLAERAGIAAGSSGVDLCCCTGAGMRFLLRFCKVAEMTGVDATEHVIARGQQRSQAQDLSNRIRFVKADVCNTGLPVGGADFVWGEDAWCYVVDKGQLIREAARIVKPGGTIAFTDWVEGATPMTDFEATRFLKFMKFANIQDLSGYSSLLEHAGCKVIIAEDTKRFAPCIDLYLQMLSMQLTYDALRIIGFDSPMMQAISGEMQFVQELAHAGKVVQGLFVARKG